MEFQNKLEEALKIVKNESETPLFVQEYRVYQNSFFSKKRLIILTERSLFYFSKKMQKHKFNLFKISSIFFDKNTVTLGFASDTNLKISLPKNYQDLKENLASSLLFIIQHLLSNSQIEHIKFKNINNTNLISKLTSIPSYYGAFCNFESSLRDEFFNFHTQSNDLLDQIRFRFSILFQRELIDLSSYKNKEYSSKNLLNALPLLPSARYLSIKQFRNNNVYSLLNNYIANFNELKNISIDGSVDYQNDTVSFSNFINSMKTNLNSKMVGLSFLNSNFTETDLNLISMYVASNGIESIEFHKTFSDKAVIDFFITTFLTSLSQSPKLTSFYIEEIEFLDIDEFLKNLPHEITSLSIVDCKCNIDQIFTTIKTDSKFSNKLDVLNLSFNTFQFDIFNFDIPSFLSVIILDYVTFPNGILVPFLNSLFRSIKNDSEISLIQMKSSDDDFSKLDRMFYNLVSDYNNKKQEIKFIRSLNWNFNPISTYFISFLKHQTRLQSLSVSGCFCPKDSKGFDDFCFYLASNDSLQNLTCRRFNKTSLESLTPRLLSAVSFSKIRFLDISNSRGGIQCYDYLKSIVSIEQNNVNNKIDINLTDNQNTTNLLNKNLSDDESENNQNKTKNETDENLNDEINKNLSDDESTNNQNKITKETDEILNDENSSDDLLNNNNEINLHNQNNIKINKLPKQNEPIHSIVRHSFQLSHENFRSSVNLNFSKSSNLKCVIYDGLMPFNKVKLMDFVEFISKNHLLDKFSFPIHDIEYLFKKQKMTFDDISKMISQSLIKSSNDYIKPFTVFYNENRHNFPFYFKNKNCDVSSMQQQINSDFDKTKNEIKAGSFFGLYHEYFDASNIKENDPYIFSFHSDDDYDCNECSCDENFDRKSSMNKFPNTKKSEIAYFKSEEKEPDKPPVKIEVEEEEIYESSSYSTQNVATNIDSTQNIIKNIDSTQNTTKNIDSTQKVATNIDSQNNNNSKNDNSNDDYEYSDYYSEDEKEKSKFVVKNQIRPIQNKTVALNRRVPLMRPVFQRKVLFNRTLNNNIKKRPVLQISLDDSSDYDYSYYDEN